MITDAARWTESIQTLHFSENGAQVPKNYHQARKQRELARKARQQEKQQRRAARTSTGGENAPGGRLGSAAQSVTLRAGRNSPGAACFTTHADYHDIMIMSL